MSGSSDQEPAAKKQRKFTEAELGGPIEDEETAQEKLEKAGFDPDDATKIMMVECPDGEGEWGVNPMIHFAGAGDLKICRYLLTRGASTTDGVTARSVHYHFGWFPMLAAASCGKREVCKWLYDHGAHQDIDRVVDDRLAPTSPLESALCPWHTPDQGMEETAKWLILHGAIPVDSEGNPCDSFMSGVFRIACNTASKSQRKFDVCGRLSRWASRACRDHDAFSTFLLGTFSRSSSGEESSSPVRCLDGYEGIRKSIAGYVGVSTSRDLRTLRGIIKPLTRACLTAYSNGVADVSNLRREK